MTQTLSSPPGQASLAALDRAHVIHPHRRAGADDPLIVVRGEGSRIWDAAGNEYLDTAAGLALTQVGHGRAELAEAAAAQMRELEYYP
jgi:PLP-dependent transaminase